MVSSSWGIRAFTHRFRAQSYEKKTIYANLYNKKYAFFAKKCILPLNHTCSETFEKKNYTFIRFRNNSSQKSQMIPKYF